MRIRGERGDRNTAQFPERDIHASCQLIELDQGCATESMARDEQGVEKNPVEELNKVIESTGAAMLISRHMARGYP